MNLRRIKFNLKRFKKSLSGAFETTSFKTAGHSSGVKLPKQALNIGRILRRRMPQRRYRSANAVGLSPSILIIGLVIFLILLTVRLVTKPKTDRSITIQNIAAMRIPTGTLTDLNELAEKNKVDFSESAALLCIDNLFFPDKSVEFTRNELQRNFFSNYAKFQQKYIKPEYQPYVDLVKCLIDEIRVFPIPEGFGGENAMFMFGDTWGDKRTYGGTRTHEGTDIMDRDNIRGRIPIVSMTAGVVENLGWNEKGGWRVGVLSESGTYYYYAHLERYANNLQIGDFVDSGTLIGYMGDTGYSKKEGTTGNFPVHLHVGICVKSSLTEGELWINPYPFLRFIEASKVTL